MAGIDYGFPKHILPLLGFSQKEGRLQCLVCQDRVIPVSCPWGWCLLKWLVCLYQPNYLLRIETQVFTWRYRVLISSYIIHQFQSSGISDGFSGFFLRNIHFQTWVIDPVCRCMWFLNQPYIIIFSFHLRLWPFPITMSGMAVKVLALHNWRCLRRWWN